MKRRTSLLLTVAAVALGALLLSSSTHLSAQQSAPAGVTVGDSDLGGVVTSANGPEAGVWVIAETTDLPTKFVKIVVTGRSGPLRACPRCRRRITRSGCAAMGLSTRPRSNRRRAASSNLTATVALSEAARRSTIRRSMVRDARDFPTRACSGHRAEWQRHAGADQEPGQWIATLKTPRAAIPAIRVGNKPTRTIRRRWVEFDSSYAAWMHRLQVGPAARTWSAASTSSTTPRCSSSRQLDDKMRPARCRPRSRSGRKASSATCGDAVGLGRRETYLHDEIATDKRNPTVNAWGPIYSATKTPPTISDPRSEVPFGDVSQVDAA